ncbi:MAG TPA: pyrroline-5-carboxylate reductase [Opitutales bacterium]|jgi:pyrroline-5-carboxylate reductase|nr:pyrroline-5-carboxylate reductase [Opitutales bacterium]
MTHVAFIGAGKMASAMVRGLLTRQLYPPAQIGCTCGADPTGPALAADTGITYEADPAKLLQPADIVVLACKPQQLAGLDSRYIPLTNGKLVLSILAGTPVAKLAAKFPGARNIVRAMPNTPGQIGAGITAWCASTAPNMTDRTAIEGILGSLGTVLELPETQIDAVTAVSGSGPAYLFEFAAAFRAAAVASGLPPLMAEKLALETIRGSAKLLEASGEDPEKLRDAVTSPGGTTEAALKVFQAANFRKIFADAVIAAKKRSEELAKL